jgi:hypothetical protein
MAYRSDVLCSPEERKAFSARKAGFALPCEPSDFESLTWPQLEEVSRFFTRRKGSRLGGRALSEDTYGIAFAMGKPYDWSILTLSPLFRSHGSDLFAREGRGADPAASLKAGLSAYSRLLPSMHPRFRKGSIDSYAPVDEFRKGSTQMIVTWIGLTALTASPGAKVSLAQIGYAGLPGSRSKAFSSCPSGTMLALAADTDLEKRREIAMLFAWWYSLDAQTRFAEAGNEPITMQSIGAPAFETYRKWNASYRAGLDHQEDIRPDPDFVMRGAEVQSAFDQAIQGAISPDEFAERIRRGQGG